MTTTETLPIGTIVRVDSALGTPAVCQIIGVNSAWPQGATYELGYITRRHGFLSPFAKTVRLYAEAAPTVFEVLALPDDQGSIDAPAL